MSTDFGSIFARFEPEHETSFHELVHVGYLTHEFEWLNHTFVMRSLTIDEELAIGQIVKHYEGTITQTKALVAAVVAASLVSVDGEAPFGGEILNDNILNLRERYKRLTEKWHWPIVEKLNDEYLILQDKVLESVKELENLSQEGRAESLESSTDLFDPSKDHPFLAGEDLIESS